MVLNLYFWIQLVEFGSRRQAGCIEVPYRFMKLTCNIFVHNFPLHKSLIHYLFTAEWLLSEKYLLIFPLKNDIPSESVSESVKSQF